MNVTKRDLRECVEANYCFSLLEVMEKCMKETLHAINSRKYSSEELRKIIHENNTMIYSCAYNLVCGAELMEAILRESENS